MREVASKIGATSTTHSSREGDFATTTAWFPVCRQYRSYRGWLAQIELPSAATYALGSCNCFFGACPAFTHVMACTLAESPSDPLHRKLRQLRCLRCRFDCYRVERTSSRAGVTPAEVQRLSRRLFRQLRFERRGTLTASYEISVSSGRSLRAALSPPSPPASTAAPPIRQQ